MHVLILGGGFGGLEVATSLRAQLDERVRITLIDKKDFFYIGFTKFDLMFGRRSPEDIKHYYSALSKKGIEFVHDTVEQMDPDHNRVKTSTSVYHYDYLVIALGVELHPEAIPGFAAGGYSFYSMDEAQRLHPAIKQFHSGTILISIFNKPYQCPPAPYEAALQLYDYFKTRGTPGTVNIKVLSPDPIPLPVSKASSDSLLELLHQHDIEFLPEHKVIALDVDKKQAVLEGREAMSYDLFIGVPIHKPPKVVLGSPFGKNGWIRVNHKNLRTEYENVYAIGDVTHIAIGNMTIPKTGAFAEDAGKAVVSDLLNRIKGEHHEVVFRAIGTCYLEAGSGKVVKVESNFLGGESPVFRFIGPSEEYRADKTDFETSRIKKWFT